MTKSNILRIIIAIFSMYKINGGANANQHCYDSPDRKMKTLDGNEMRCTIDAEDDISNPDRIVECSRINNCENFLA